MKLKDSGAPSHKRVYINECLSKQTAALFANVRRMIKDGIFYRAWTTDGIIRVIRVLLTDDTHARPRKVYTEGDLKDSVAASHE